MRAPSFRGRFSGYKHVRRAGQTVKECCLHAARQLAPYIPKTSAGRFRPNLPITDRPRQPLGTHEELVSHFAVPNVWHRKRVCGSRGWHCTAVTTTVAAIFWAIFGRRVVAIG